MVKMIIDEIDRLYRENISDHIENYDGSQNKEEFKASVEYLDGCIKKIEDKEIWFLEIGAYKGLWALAFNVLCRENNKTPRYVTVTWVDHDPNNQDIFNVKKLYEDQGLIFELINANSLLPETVDRVAAIEKAYHFVFIDADHAFASVMKDIKNYAPLAVNKLFFHDIHTKQCGVAKAIDKSGIRLNIKISYGDVMGIGIHDCCMENVPPARKILGIF